MLSKTGRYSWNFNKWGKSFQVFWSYYLATETSLRCRFLLVFRCVGPTESVGKIHYKLQPLILCKPPSFSQLLISVSGCILKSKLELLALKVTNWRRSLLPSRIIFFPTCVSGTFYTPDWHIWILTVGLQYASEISVGLVMWPWIASESPGQSCTQGKCPTTLFNC